jgi:hypothetical protein
MSPKSAPSVSSPWANPRVGSPGPATSVKRGTPRTSLKEEAADVPVWCPKCGTILPPSGKCVKCPYPRAPPAPSPKLLNNEFLWVKFPLHTSDVEMDAAQVEIQKKTTAPLIFTRGDVSLQWISPITNKKWLLFWVWWDETYDHIKTVLSMKHLPVPLTFVRLRWIQPKPRSASANTSASFQTSCSSSSSN